MDMIFPDKIAISSSSQQLLNDLDSVGKEIDDHRPLPNEIVQSVERELLGDRVYSSNSIEGNTHTIQETNAILSMGQIVDVGRKREGQEVINLGKAITSVQEMLSTGQSLFLADNFRLVHLALLTDIDDDIAGRYRNERVMISGAKYQPPKPGEVPLLMSESFAHVEQAKDLHPVVLATWLHWAIARIHPFMDGNGRMARLWQDAVLLKHHYTPAVIPQSQRKLYYKSLQLADEGDFTELLQLIIQSASQTSQMYLNAIQESDVIADWATTLVQSSEDLADDALKLQYHRWKSGLESLRDAFSRCIKQVSRKTTQFDLNLHPYDIIDQATWETLRSDPRVGRNWCFRIFSQSQSSKFQYVFFAGKHFSSDRDSGAGVTGPQVNVLISEQEGSGESEILSGHQALPLTLREILIVDGKFIRKRWDKAAQKEVYDTDLTAIEIAQDFIKEIVLHRLTS